MSTPLAPLDPTLTKHGRWFRSSSNPGGPTRREVSEATTADHVWRFEREDSPGTPWLLIHVESNRVVDMCSSLRKCREAVARGWADKTLADQQAGRNGYGPHPWHSS